MDCYTPRQLLYQLHSSTLAPLLLILLLLAGCGGGGGGSSKSTGPAVGIDNRPNNISCTAGESPTDDSGVSFDQINDGASLYVSKLIQEPSDPKRWFVLKRQGQIYAVDSLNNRISWVDIRDLVTAEGNGGLISLAFHPGYPETPEVFVYYTKGTADAFVAVLTRITVDDVLKPVNFTLEEILTVNQATTFHQGADVLFGPDGYLYVSIGESGCSHCAQDVTNLRGTVIRIDVLGTDVPYGIPSDNPFVDNSICGPGMNSQACPEIFAWGFRNPFRMSFDAMGRLWEGDVGADLWEEVNLVEMGGNYGWPCREGRHDYQPEKCAVETVLTDPIVEYSHDQGDGSITGGHVYTGPGIPELQGKYIYGDFVSGRVFALSEAAPGNYTSEELFDTSVNITSIAQDDLGELYFTEFYEGSINKIVPSTIEDPVVIPQFLSDVGCFDTTDPSQPDDALIPYTINAPFWSDDAQKERFMAIPNGQVIDVDDDGDWTFPIGSILAKHFRLAGKLIETRLLMLHEDGEWAGYTYAWNEDETDAERVIGGRISNFDGQDWLYPSEGQCLECHTVAAKSALGPETSQLNGDSYYPYADVVANQLEALNHIGLFRVDIGRPEDLDKLAPPDDDDYPLGERARAWLHTNCAQCHRPGGVSQANIDFRYFTPLPSMNVCNIAPSQGELGLDQPMLIAPGDPDRSVVWERLRRRDAEGMPPLGSFIADDLGVDLISSWIGSLEDCF